MLAAGLDVHWRRSTFCVLDANGKHLETRTVRGRWSKVLEELKEVKKRLGGDGERMQVCFEASCVARCDAPSQLCGDDNALCCANGEACIGGACVPLLDECALGEDCEIDELCEPSLGVCIPRDAVDVCEFRPPVGEFEPAIGCHSFRATGITNYLENFVPLILRG